MRSFVLAAQHVDHVAGAEALAGAVDRRERLLRQLGAVEALGRLQADVAVAAGLGALLAEIAEQHLPPAARGLAVAEQRVELLPLDMALALAGGLGPGQQALELADVVQAVEHPGLGRQPVAPGAAGLLVRPRGSWAGRDGATKRTSGLSMPMPKAIVATMTTPSSLRKRSWLAARTSLSRPAW